MYSHCQICERYIKANTGLIAHHGYTRPYPQEQTTSCAGARELPYEVSRDAIPAAIKWNQSYLTYQEERLVEYMTAGPETLSDYSPFRPAHVYSRPEGFDPEYCAENWETSPSKGYEREFYQAIRQIKRNIEMATSEVNRLQRRYDNWVKEA